MNKRILLSILFLLTFCNLCFASISVDAFLTGDDVTISHLDTMRSTFQGAINSADGGLLQTGTVTSAKLDANSNPENRWAESFNDFVYTGLVIPQVTGLSTTTTAGTAYIEGVRVVKDATAHTYTANKTTYVDLSKNGTYTYSEVTHGATVPTVTANSIRIAMVSTDTSNIVTVDDVRVTSVTLGSGAVTSLSNPNQNTMVEVNKSSGENVIRFTTTGTERMNISATGFLGGSAIEKLFPVGYIYISTVSTNPNTVLGFGTWTAFGAGRVLVGKNTSGTFVTAGATGGEETHTLITAEIPAHTHPTKLYHNSGAVSNYPTREYTNDDSGNTVVSGSTGGDGAHNNLQPYIVVYMWERTA